MKICFVGLDDLPALAEEYGHFGVGGEQVQHALLAKALTKRGYEASMVVFDYGQDKIEKYHGVTTIRTFKPHDGVPILRFIYPRWTKIWSAMRRANADLYYVSCAGMHLGLAAMFCQKYKKRLAFRVAHDTDCEPGSLLIKYARDKWLYEYGIRHTDVILVQTTNQRIRLLENYGRIGHIARMLVDRPELPVARNFDLLWVNNIRPFKRPEKFLDLARSIPDVRCRMIGGVQPGHESLYRQIQDEASSIPNLEFHGAVPYHKMDVHYSGAKIFVNTSDSEGFPNSYLQSWIRGTPVVAFFDPDSVIKSAHLGIVVHDLANMRSEILSLLANEPKLAALSAECKSYIASKFSDDDVLVPYLHRFEEVFS